jgi:hypothetical protein
VTDPVRPRLRSLGAALAFPLTTLRRAAAATGVAAVTYCLLVLSSYPAYVAGMLRGGPGYVDDALLALTANTVATTGTVGIALVVAYSLLTGVTLVDLAARVRLVGLDGAGGLGGLLPGLVASGCASCGAGVLGLLGAAGALAALPFHGNLLRVGGLLLLLGVLARTGDPRRGSTE